MTRRFFVRVIGTFAGVCMWSSLTFAQAGPSASGNARTPDNGMSLNFSATQHEDGSMTGVAVFDYRYPGYTGKVHIDVDCVLVQPEGSDARGEATYKAWISGVVTRSSGPPATSYPEGLEVTFAVLDNGEGGWMDPAYSGDGFGSLGFANAGPCSWDEMLLETFDPRGNIQVRP